MQYTPDVYVVGPFDIEDEAGMPLQGPGTQAGQILFVGMARHKAAASWTYATQSTKYRVWLLVLSFTRPCTSVSKPGNFSLNSRVNFR